MGKQIISITKLMLRNTFLIFSIFVVLAGCSSYRQDLDNIDTTNLAELKNVRVYPRSPSTAKTELGQLRAKSLEDTGMSVGAQAGLAWASAKMNIQMSMDRKYLDRKSVV